MFNQMDTRVFSILWTIFVIETLGLLYKIIELYSTNVFEKLYTYVLFRWKFIL